MSVTDEIKRNVSFGYFQVYKNPGIREEKFDLIAWISKISSLNLNERGVGILGDVVRCDECTACIDGDEDISILHFTKLRGNNTPAVANIKTSGLKDITLSADEFIAEDVSALFDSKNSILMLQKNIYSLSISALEDYINYFWNKDRVNGTEEKIELRPVLELDTFKRGKNARVYKSISIKTAEIQSSGVLNFFKGSLESIIDSVKSMDGIYLNMTISAGRKKDSRLASEEVRNLIEEIESNQMDFKKASVVTTSNGKSEMIELLDSKLLTILEFTIPAKKYLEPKEVQEKMAKTYCENGMRNKVTECIGG